MISNLTAPSVPISIENSSSFHKRPLSPPKLQSSIPQQQQSPKVCSKMSQLLLSEKSPTTVVSAATGPNPACKITFNCPQPSRKCMFNKSAAFQHTPPPSRLLQCRFEDEEDEDDDDNDYDSSYEDDEDDDDDSTHQYSKDDVDDGIFLSD